MVLRNFKKGVTMTVDQWIKAAKENARLFFIEDNTVVKSFPTKHSQLKVGVNGQLLIDFGSTETPLLEASLSEKELYALILNRIKTTYKL